MQVNDADEYDEHGYPHNHLWLRSLSSQLLELRTLDRDASDRRVKDMPPQQQISIIREQVSQVLTTEHAEAVLAALPEVESVLTARNHLVHGIWLPNADRTMYAAQKAGRRGNPFSEQRFTRRDLLRLHRRARESRRITAQRHHGHHRRRRLHVGRERLAKDQAMETLTAGSTARSRRESFRRLEAARIYR